MTAASLPAAASRANGKVLFAGAAVAVPLLAVLLLNLGRDPHTVRSPLVGHLAPHFSLAPAGGGAQVDLASLRGSPVILNFWATWCVPCIAEHEALAAAARKAPEVRFLGLLYEDEESRAEAFLAQRGRAYPTLIDPQGRTAIAYGVAGVPETFAIDAQGGIVEKRAGPVDAQVLEALVARARGHTP